MEEQQDGIFNDPKTLIPTYEEEPLGLMAVVKGAGGGTSIAERRAAKFGFNAGKISTPRFRTTSPLASPAARSPCVTIPPGISPAALLDSPVMLPNTQALPSPTTGTFPLPSFSHESFILNSTTSENENQGNGIDSFRFKLNGDNMSPPRYSSFGNQRTGAMDQPMVLEKPSAGFEFPMELAGEAATKYCLDLSNGIKFLNNMIIDAKSADKKTYPEITREQTSPSREPIQEDDNATHDLLAGNQNGSDQSVGIARTSEDGYNWRKYGQKQVKGSEYPRSYYKCTHQDCLVKKKVERSHDGQITEIIYKGAHNHAKPQPNRRAPIGSGSDEMSEVSEGSGTCVKIEGGSVWTNFQSGSASNKLCSDGKADGMEITSSASILTDHSDPLSTAHGKSIGMIESTEIVELSTTVASHEDDEDGAIQASMSLEGDADDEEPESKRRKKESSLIETNLTSRTVREPRVVVQIESEIDILDDGYRWRKYGQKVVKGNPNPRSYYKCTSAGCSVRKHVERASHDLKCVITTYEGKHNHEVPAARNSNHMNSSGANVPPGAANNAQSALTLPRNTTIPKPEPQVKDLVPHFDRKPEFGNEYLRPSFPGNFSNDVTFGASSLYPMKFPPLQSTMPYASFGLNPNCFASQQTSPVPPAVPDFPMSLPLTLTPSRNLPLLGFDFNSGKRVAPFQPISDFNSRKPVAPFEPLLSGQQLQQNDTRFIRPKQEQKDDILYDASMSLADHENALSLSSSYSSSPVYNRIMGNFPS